MKQKSDETLDAWVRQSLQQLPDTPPPGSTFDSERLWSQLRPEIQPISSQRKTNVVWWAAAACLAGLILGWLWLYPLANDHPTKLVSSKLPTVATPTTSHPNENSARELPAEHPTFAEKDRPRLSLKTSNRPKVSMNIEPPLRPEESVNVVTQNSELPSAAEVIPVAEKPIDPGKPKVVVAMPKRRFRVMHENELRAEEEARPRLYQSNHFVRIGSERSEEPATEPHQTDLIMALTTKKTQ